MSGISDPGYVSHKHSHSYDQSSINQSNTQAKLLVGSTAHSISVLAHTDSIPEKLKDISESLNKNIQSDLNCGEFTEEELLPNALNEFSEIENNENRINSIEQNIFLEEKETSERKELENVSKANNSQIKETRLEEDKVDSKAELTKNEQKKIAHAKLGGVHSKFKHFHVGDKNVGDIVQEKMAKCLKENNKLTCKDVNRILNSVLQKAKYHDPETGEIKKLTKEQIEELKGLIHEYAAEALNLHNLTVEEHKPEKEDVIIHDKTHSELAQTKTDNKRHPQLPIITFVSYQAGVSGREISRLTSILDKIADITRKMNEKKQKQKDAAADERKAENLKEDIKKEELKREDLKHNIQNGEIIKEQQTRGGTAFHPEVDTGESFSRNTHKIWP